MDGSQPRARVAMIVGNDVTADTRVKKTAASLARHGYDVTVLALSPSGSRTETSMGDVRIVRLPVPFVLRDRRRRRRELTRPRLGYASKEQYVAAKRRSKVAEREFLAYAGRQRAKLEQVERRAHPVLSTLERQRMESVLKARHLVVKVRGEVVRRRQARREGSNSSHDPRRGIQFPLLIKSRLMAVGARWRQVLPQIDDYELSFGPELDAIRPDVIHAHDVHMIGIAERAAARARLHGRQVRWIYDAHEYVPGLPQYTARQLAAFVDLEREYISRADRIITVSDPIADELVRSFGLPRRPTVVMNVPFVTPVDEGSPSVRRAAGVSEDAPLLVYSGGVSRNRGLHTIVEALPLLPDTHLALVVKGGSKYVDLLRRMADALGCSNRLHVVPFVDPDHVVAYLSSATAAVSALTHYGNHEVALPNKLFDYLHAQLPVLVSDVKAMACFTRRHGVGEVFRAEDPVSFAEAATKVLSDPDRYIKALEEQPDLLSEHSWQSQERALLDLYRDLLGGNSRIAEPTREAELSLTERKSPHESASHAAVALGPRNVAGQAWAWARALEQSLPDVRTSVFTVEKKSALMFPTDVRIPYDSWFSLDWQVTQLRHVLTTYTHVLLESGSGLWGTLNGPSYEADLPSLDAKGITAAVVLHGSEVRDPRRHRELEPWSPFQDASTDLCRRLQAGVDDLLPRLGRFDGPIFVTTMDLMAYVPTASWLPVVVDTSVWTPGPPPLQRPRPVVVHAPSRAELKGSGLIEKVVTDLHAQGVIEYRRVQDIPPEKMPEVLADADVVLDQFAIGDYGAVAVQAMASERIVVGHVHERVRTRLPADVPIVEATPDTLGDVMVDIAKHRDRYVEAAGRGPGYVEQFHDGTYSVAQLAAFLGRDATPTVHAEALRPHGVAE